mmetsp:Transcript_35174/g.79376  ORF Transcript_35174/g.79376 Transcript_35174/m.79376 type:complete len:308 (+) Transcript_35174:380-1303(+)
MGGAPAPSHLPAEGGGRGGPLLERGHRHGVRGPLLHRDEPGGWLVYLGKPAIGGGQASQPATGGEGAGPGPASGGGGRPLAAQARRQDPIQVRRKPRLGALRNLQGPRGRGHGGAFVRRGRGRVQGPVAQVGPASRHPLKGPDGQRGGAGEAVAGVVDPPLEGARGRGPAGRARAGRGAGEAPEGEARAGRPQGEGDGAPLGGGDRALPRRARRVGAFGARACHPGAFKGRGLGRHRGRAEARAGERAAAATRRRGGGASDGGGPRGHGRGRPESAGRDERPVRRAARAANRGANRGPNRWERARVH